MMKIFRRMSLTQQVISMILLMLIFLSVFFAFFLNTSLDRTIAETMYSIMANAQKPIVTLIQDEDAPSAEQLMRYMSADTAQTGFLYQNHVVHMPASTSLSPRLREWLGRESQILLDSAADSRDGQCESDGKYTYFHLQKVFTDAGQVVVGSCMNDNYANQYRNSIVNSTVYMMIIVFFLLLMALVIWVFSIIRPLNQIRSYIEQVKEGKDVELNIVREDEIGELAQELKVMKEELDKQDKAKEEMIHNISHDLKTPIATIKSYSESIKDGIYPYGDLDSSVDVILHNAKRLEDKVHNLLYLNRVEYLVSSDASGVVTNMKEVTEQVVLNAAVIRPEIQVITDVEEVFFDGLMEAWRVSMENIMDNAYRYARSCIKIRVREDELEIFNDGPPMPEERIEALFRPYEKGEGGRFGLGLSIVSKVAKANDYVVEGKNTKDGVVFRIFRPRKKVQKKNRRQGKK